MNMRAALICAALFFSGRSFSKEQNSTEVIEAAQQLLLAKKRQEALQNLVKFKQQKIRSTKEIKALNGAIVEIAERFLTERGQKLFELGISHIPAQPKEALESLTAAKKIEEGNSLIAISLGKAYLILERCAEARQEWESVEDLSGSIDAVHELAIHLGWCGKDEKFISEYISKRPNLSPTITKVAQGWLKQKEKNTISAIALFQEAVHLNTKNVAGWYWLWQAKTTAKETAEEPTAQFIKNCRLSRRNGFSQLIFSEFCFHLVEIEAYQKTLTSQGEDSR